MDDKNFEALASKNFDFSLRLKRIQHYQFAYQTLPTLIFERGEQLLNKWTSKDEAEMNLKQAWEQVGKVLPTKLSSDGLSIERTTQSGWTIFTVNLPKPEIQPEAYFCFVLFNPISKLIKFYTAEKGLFGNVLGEMTSEGAHLNFGKINDLDHDLIIKQIISLNK